MTTRSRDYKIHLKNERNRLVPRREPYWRHIAVGRHIGYRKTESGSETWVARFTDDDDKFHTLPLGTVAAIDWSDATAKANEWFAQCNAGIVRSQTVEAICRAYVDNRRIEVGAGNADDAEKRFKTHVYGTQFGRIRLDKLGSIRIENWRNELLANTTSEMCKRTFKTLRAALNYGFRQGAIASDSAWKRVPLSVGPQTINALDFYWSVEDRRAFLEKCPGELRDFLTAIALTAARPQEIAIAKTKDFNLFARKLVLRHRKGKGSEWRERGFSLSNDAALAFFKRVSASKLPETPLLTRSDGSSWYSQNGNGLWVSALKKVRRDGEFDDRVTAYHFRHWSITDWLNAGIVTANVATIAGTSIDMIDSYYKKHVKGRVDAQLASMETVL
jgi:integrase